MKRKILIGILLAAIALVATYVVARSIQEKKLTARGNAIVEKVEGYRTEHGRLPENLREMGLPESEEGPFYYEKRGDTNYVVFFSEGFDDTWGYYSDSKQWEYGYRK